MILYGDLETYSEVPLKHGVYKYAAACEILLFTYAIDDGPVNVVDFDGNAEGDLALQSALFDADTVVFHNSMFDRTVLGQQAPALCPPIERWRDTMVQALAHSLPGGLEKLCSIFRVPVAMAKLQTGKQLIQLFCKPRPKNSTIRRATRETHPREWQQFVEYAVHDVEAMRYLHRAMPSWNYAGDELRLWHLDQRINDRGIPVDLELARTAVATIGREKRRLAAESASATGGQVASTTQRDVLLRYLLAEHGVELPDLKGDTLERRLADPDLPQAVRDLIANRLQAASGAPSKYKALLDAVSSDGRLRGTKQFCGAGRTGRWAGRIFQPDNLMRPPKYVKAMGEEAIQTICADVADVLFDNPTEVIAGVVRGVICAPAGKKFAIADWSNIEGRVLAWLAGEEWKLQAFRDRDAGTGHDLYALAYSRAFRVTPESVMADDAAGGIQRQVGKVMELALGYQGAVGAFVSMAANYGVDLDAMAALAWPVIPEHYRLKADNAWLRAREEERTFGLTQRVWCTCHALTHMWRSANANIESLWYSLESAVRQVVTGAEATLAVGRLTIDREGNWLRIRLPSGRFLCYPSPRVDDAGKVSYMGINQYTRKWQRIPSYGGKFAENVTQAVARDVLGHAIPRLEENDFPLVLHVHDEPIAEVVEDDDRLELLGEIMRTPPPWADGLPLAAGAHYANRYQKE